MWLLYAIASSILWGLEYSINGRILKHIHSLSLLCFQLLLGFLICCLGTIFFKKNIVIEDARYLLKNYDLIGFFLLSILIYIIANFCIYQSITLKNSALAAAIETTYPFFTFLFCYLLFKENFLNLKVFFGSILIFLGISILYFA